MSKLGEKVHDKKVFRPYNQDQMMIPMSMDFFIPENHVVRVVYAYTDKRFSCRRISKAARENIMFYVICFK